MAGTPETTTAEAAGRRLTMTRLLPAPPEVVWAAWTEAEHLMHWLCPTGFVVLFADNDARPGGLWRSGMRAPDGREYVAGGRYRELQPPGRLVFTHRWERSDVEPSVETVVTVTLEPEGVAATRMTFVQSGFATDESRESHEGGWAGAFDRLARRADAARAPEDTELVLQRVFDAPRHLVWEACTRADHLAGWWGPRGFDTRVEAQDLRVGGRWRYVMVGPDGTAYPSEGQYLDVVPYERYVTTDEFGEGFEPPDGGGVPAGLVTTMLFEDFGDGTRLTVRIAHASVGDRSRHEAMGVLEGFASTFECLDDYLARMRRTQGGG